MTDQAVRNKRMARADAITAGAAHRVALPVSSKGGAAGLF